MEEKTIDNQKKYDYITEFPPTILVKTLDLCKEIIDMGYLKNLKDVRPTRYDPSKRVFYFDYIPEINERVRQYIEEKREKYAERNADKY